MSSSFAFLLSTALSPAHASSLGASDLSAGDLVVSEFMANPKSVGARNGEWIEIYNNTSSDVDLNGLTITAVGSFTIGSSVVVAAGDYVLLANNSSSTSNGGLPTVDYTYSYSDLEIGNKSGTVSISYGSTTIDSVSYSLGAGFPTPWGATISLDYRYVNADDNNYGYRWCGGTSTYGSGDTGTPGAGNDACPTPLIDLSAGTLVISEVMPQPAGVLDRYGEWLEIANTHDEQIDLYQLTVTSGSDSFTITTHVYIDAGAMALIAAESGSSLNGGLPTVDYAYGTAISLDNTDSLTISYEDTTFDEVSWDSTYPMFNGIALNLDHDSIDGSLNDSVDSWCAASSFYSTDDMGSPGAANDVCLSDEDGDGVTSATDCDDTDPDINPFATEVCDDVDNDCDGDIDEGVTSVYYQDADGDGYGLTEVTVEACTQPSGYTTTDGDCNDLASDLNPGAIEVCDEVDNDCDGATDEYVKPRYYQDADGDGYGDPTVSDNFCEQPSGYVSDSTDCDDTSADAYPDAIETCDDIDNDCDGDVDEFVKPRYYQDADGDGYGDPATGTASCEPLSGYVLTSDDCNDSSADAFPGAVETCDEIDNDCDGTTDEDVTLTWYADTDGDGFGDLYSPLEACTLPSGYTDNTSDCDDSSATTYPGAEEVCDDIDNDCDGTTDEGEQTWYLDNDGDGDGDASTATQSCELMEGYVLTGSDCDDTDATAYQGAIETCDGVDNNCDGDIDEGVELTWYADTDGDGYGDPASTVDACEQPSGYADNTEDCDDSSSTTNPGAAETCDDADNDCDGDIDEEVGQTWYADTDGDGYGDPASTVDACEQPSGYTDNTDDCDDSSAGTSPDAVETCDELDNDCDGDIDEEVGQTWYADTDGDGYGDPASTTVACTQPEGSVASDEDCDDSDSSILPGALDTCDDIDNDCDGTTDEDAETFTFYTDSDGDGYGDPTDTVEACAQPEGTVDNADDPDDGDATSTPEACDGIDNDGDGVIDNGFDLTTFYTDSDGDGYGDPTDTVEACAQPEGTVDNAEDCDDNTADTSPEAAEVCDGIDNDCDGSTDEELLAYFYADIDEDGYGDPGDAIEACSASDGYVSDDTDCDDSLSSVNPGMEEVCDELDNDCDDDIDEDLLLTWYADLDRDAYGDASFTAESCAPVSIFDTEDSDDCDDRDASIYPGATEVCDTVDNNCDGDVDEGLTQTWFEDDDGDGYGDAADPVEACEQPDGFVESSDDCDDLDPYTYPDAAETCDLTDNNCDGNIDEDVALTFYADADGDGYGNPDTAMTACEAPSGYVTNSDDCNDCDSEAWEDGSEACETADTCDCEARTVTYCSDETTMVLDASGAPLHYAEEVGFVHSAWNTDLDATWIWSSALVEDPTVDETVVFQQSINLPEDAAITSATLDILADNTYTASFNGGDAIENTKSRAYAHVTTWDVTSDLVADDNTFVVEVTNYGSARSSAYSNPAGLAYCVTVEYVGSPAEEAWVTFYADADGDGYGDPTRSTESLTQPEGYVLNDADCDDTDSSIQGESSYYADADADGYGDPADAILSCGAPDGYVSDDTDCDDSFSSVHPDAIEVCDELDNDCDDDIDEAVTTTAWLDADGDQHGNPEKPVETCYPTPLMASVGDDCDDSASMIHPGATEVCDELDNDCDSDIDEGVTSTFYADNDIDSYGDAVDSVEACVAPEGYVTDATDCDDDNSDSFPGAEETCDNLDNNCDGLVDNGLADLDESGTADCREVVVIVTDRGVQRGSQYSCEGQSALDRELSEMEDALQEMGLSMVTLLEDRDVGISLDELAPYSTIIYHNLGWSKQGAPETIESLSRAADMGKSLVLMGDDISYLAYRYERKYDDDSLMQLASVADYRHNGFSGRSAERADTTHPVIDGPWGTVDDFPYAEDIDQTTTRNRGEEHLMYIEGTDYPAVWAKDGLSQRTVTMAVGLYTSKACPLSDSDGLDAMRSLFQNAVWWAGAY